MQVRVIRVVRKEQENVVVVVVLVVVVVVALIVEFATEFADALDGNATHTAATNTKTTIAATAIIFITKTTIRQ